MLRVSNVKFVGAIVGVVVPALLAFSIPNLLFRYFGLLGVTFDVVSVTESTLSPTWIYFLAAFCSFSYLVILLSIVSNVTRFHYLGGLKTLALVAIEVSVAFVVLYAVLSKSSSPMSGLNVVGQGVMEASLGGHTMVGTKLTLFQVFNWMHSIFTFTAAYVATLCAVNFSIFALPYHGARDHDLAFFKKLYREHLYATVAVWCIGVAQLVAWLRLPVSSIAPEQATAFTRHVFSVSVFYSLNYTLVLLTCVAASAALRQRARTAAEQDTTGTSVLDNKLFLIIAAPLITGFLANVLSAYFG